MIYGVVLAGGRGERFWPLSRKERPKQFLKLISDKTMIEETIERVRPFIPMEHIRIVTSDLMKDTITQIIPGIKDINILGEPQGRNTALAIGLAAVHLLKEDPDAVMVVLSADHLIRPAERLLKILEAGTTIAASEDSLITIGVVPTRPETGYGYIKLGELYRRENEFTIYQVAAFKEKPKATVASEYYYSGNYLWNSGMFVWSAKAILNAVKVCHCDLGTQLEEYSTKIGTAEEADARQKLYEETTPISIDFAVLENAENVLTIKADIIWDDVGDWRALERYKKMDVDNNVIVGDVVTVETFESTIYNNADGIIACLGVSDLIVVRSDNITLIVHKSRAQEVKELLAKLHEDEKMRTYL